MSRQIYRYTATRLIRQLPLSNSEVVIVGLSAKATDTDSRKALEAGMNNDLTKPIQPVVLKNIIERLGQHSEDSAYAYSQSHSSYSG